MFICFSEKMAVSLNPAYAEGGEEHPKHNEDVWIGINNLHNEKVE